MEQLTKEAFLLQLKTRREAEAYLGVTSTAFQYHLREEHIVPCKVAGTGKGKVQLFWKEDLDRLKETYLTKE